MRLAWLSLPLGLTMLLLSLNTNIPRYFIEHYLDTSALGIFAALAAVTRASDMVVQALGQSASPRLAKLYAASDSKSFCRILFKVCRNLAASAPSMIL